MQGLQGIVPVQAFFLLLQASQARVTLRRLAGRREEDDEAGFAFISDQFCGNPLSAEGLWTMLVDIHR